MQNTHQELLNSVPKHCAPVGRVLLGLADQTGIRNIPSCSIYELRYWEQVSESLVMSSQRLRSAAGQAIRIYNSVIFPKGVPNVQGSQYQEIPVKETTSEYWLNPNDKEATPWYVFTEEEAPNIPGYLRILVGDSMEYDPEVTYGSVVSIEQSWVDFIKCLSQGKPVMVDLSRLRPAGTESEKGIIASGAETFSEIYERLADLVAYPSVISYTRAISMVTSVIRRGGTAFKKGATTVFLDMDHPEADDFITCPSRFIEKTKRGMYVKLEWLLDPKYSQVFENLVAAVDEGTMFLVNRDKLGEYSTQVCVEILFKGIVKLLGQNYDNGFLERKITYEAPSCLLTHVNAASFDPSNILELPKAFAEIAKWMCELHYNSGMDRVAGVLSPKDDPQVGMGVIGFANHLAQMGVTYAEFAQDMREVRIAKENGVSYTDMKPCLAREWWYAYQCAAEVFTDYFRNYLKVPANIPVRAFTLPPTASSALMYTDVNGFSCARSVEPPMGMVENNNSQTSDSKVSRYPENIELYKNVGFEVYQKLCEEFQLMWEYFELAHIQSFNVPFSVKITKEWIIEFISKKILGSVYYRIGTNDNLYIKDSIYDPEDKEANDEVVDLASCNIGGECTSCAG